MLPLQLQNDAFGFVKLKPKTKIPFEKEWQKNPYTHLQIADWISRRNMYGFPENNNYGVICGIGNLIVIDSDDEELSKVLHTEFPETFTVKTSKGFHFYFLCKDCNKKIVLSKAGKHCGEIISGLCQVVGANCLHPSGSRYLIEKNLAIAEVCFN